MTERGLKEKNAKARKPYNRILPTAPRRGRRSVPFEIIYRPGIKKDMDVIEHLLSLRAYKENVTGFITEAIREHMKGK